MMQRGRRKENLPCDFLALSVDFGPHDAGQNGLEETCSLYSQEAAIVPCRERRALQLLGKNRGRFWGALRT